MRYDRGKRAYSDEIFEERPVSKEKFKPVPAHRVAAALTSHRIPVRDAEGILNRGGILHLGDKEVRKTPEHQSVLRGREKRKEAYETVKSGAKTAGRAALKAGKRVGREVKSAYDKGQQKRQSRRADQQGTPQNGQTSRPRGPSYSR